MTKDEAIKIIWDYMRVNHQLERADIIVALGSHDTRIAHRAAELWKEGWAPYLVLSGSGTRHKEKLAWKAFGGRTEADVFYEIALEVGVPQEAIVIENKSQNTGENLQFTKALLENKGIHFDSAILVQKPLMERRVYATAKVQWPEKKIIVTSPQLSLEHYQKGLSDDWWVHAMVGDLQRIKEYPKLGFQIPQEIPDEVFEAFELLVSIGYDQYLIKV